METENGTPSAAINAANDAKRAERAAVVPTPPKSPKAAAPRRNGVSAAKKAENDAKALEAARALVAANAPSKTGRSARTPRERAALPPTATIAAYVDFLSREIFDGKPGTRFAKLSPREREIAAISITGYGAYQKSDERRTARGY